MGVVDFYSGGWLVLNFIGYSFEFIEIILIAFNWPENCFILE